MKLEDVKTLDDAVQYQLPRFKGMEHYVLNYPKEQFIAFCHFQASGGIGMKIRNEFGFWTEDTAIFKHMREVQKCIHPDAMSSMILGKIYDVIENQILDSVKK